MNRSKTLIVRLVATGLVLVAATLLIMGYGWKGVFASLYLGVPALLLVHWQIKALIAAFCLALFLGLVIPLVDPAAPSRRRVECQDKMTRLAHALRTFHDANGRLPTSHTIDADGKPLHSWRVQLLPYLGEQDLYDRIRHDKPWNDVANVPFHDRMPAAYGCPEQRFKTKWHTLGNTTAYVAITSASDGKSMVPSDSQHSQRLIYTFVESERHRVSWMSPHDPTFAEYVASLRDQSTSNDDSPHASLFFHVIDRDGTAWSTTVDSMLDLLDQGPVKELFLFEDHPSPEQDDGGRPQPKSSLAPSPEDARSEAQGTASPNGKSAQITNRD